MPRRAPLPDHLRAHAFDRADVEAAGISQGRLRRPDVVNPYHGVHSASVPTSLVEHCSAYSVRLRPGQSFSHQTAAHLHELPLPPRYDAITPLHVAAVRPASAPRTAGVVGHRLNTAPRIVAVHGLPVASPTATWVQLADVLELDELVAVADHLLTVSSLDEGVARRLLARRVAEARRRSTVTLLAALGEERRPVLSPGETRVRLLLVRAGLPAPECNGVVTTASGTYLGRPDLVWRAHRVGLEYEGGHHAEPQQALYDVERRERFEDHGWHIVRATKYDLQTTARRTALVDRMRRRLDLHRPP